jgi:hypothetical protein
MAKSPTFKTDEAVTLKAKVVAQDGDNVTIQLVGADDAPLHNITLKAKDIVKG